MTDEEIYSKYIDILNIPSIPNTRSLFAIGFIGITGSGKSFLSQELSSKTGLMVTSGDKIRRYLNSIGRLNDHENQPLTIKIAQGLTSHLYQNKISHIIDQDLLKFYDDALTRAQGNGAKLILIKLECSEQVILKRIQQRTLSLESNPDSNLSRANLEKYYERKLIYESSVIPDDLIYQKINTDGNISEISDKLILDLKESKLL